MTSFIDFIDLIHDEVYSLLDITPWYIQAIFYIACLFSVVLAIKRAIIG